MSFLQSWTLSFVTCNRVVAGATILDHVFTAKIHIADRRHYLRNKFHLQGYLATSLKKIQVLPINDKFYFLELSEERVLIMSITLAHFSLPYADFFNWNRIKIRYCDGASFAGDSENKVCGILSHIIVVFLFTECLSSICSTMNLLSDGVSLTT